MWALARLPLTPPWALPALLLALAARGAVAAGGPTYRWRDADTREWLVCGQCPPGTFVQRPCSRDSPTACGACPERHYTQFWNYLERCRYCNVICGEHEEEARPCTATHNRACRCRAGFFEHAGFCLEHAPCPPGAGVLAPGGCGAPGGRRQAGTPAPSEDTPASLDTALFHRQRQPEHAVPAVPPGHLLSQQLQLRAVPAPPQLHGPGPGPQPAWLPLPRRPVHQLQGFPTQHAGAGRGRDGGVRARPRGLHGLPGHHLQEAPAAAAGPPGCGGEDRAPAEGGPRGPAAEAVAAALGAPRGSARRAAGAAPERAARGPAAPAGALGPPALPAGPLNSRPIYSPASPQPPLARLPSR